jgi:hypothetical protein
VLIIRGESYVGEAVRDLHLQREHHAGGGVRRAVVCRYLMKSGQFFFRKYERDK